jgi:hypothetical protein
VLCVFQNWSTSTKLSEMDNTRLRSSEA